MMSMMMMAWGIGLCLVTMEMGMGRSLGTWFLMARKMARSGDWDFWETPFLCTECNFELVLLGLVWDIGYFLHFCISGCLLCQVGFSAWSVKQKLFPSIYFL